MATARENGTYQVASHVSPALRAAMAARADLEGIGLSTLIRKALMLYLRVDAAGQVVPGSPPAPVAGCPHTPACYNAHICYTSRPLGGDPVAAVIAPIEGDALCAGCGDELRVSWQVTWSDSKQQTYCTDCVPPLAAPRKGSAGA